MILEENCIGTSCEHSRVCKIKKQKRNPKCPVYAYEEKKIVLFVNAQGVLTNAQGVIITSSIAICPSCGEACIIFDTYNDTIWGHICGSCLYELKAKGYPVNQAMNMLKKRKYNERSERIGRMKAWDIERGLNNE